MEKLSPGRWFQDAVAIELEQDFSCEEWTVMDKLQTLLRLNRSWSIRGTGAPLSKYAHNFPQPFGVRNIYFIII
jgi:hypothetical protein